MNVSSLPAPQDARTLGQQLLDEHLRLAALSNRVVEAFEEGDREACDEAFRELERRLEDHLRFEERELVPQFARSHPAEAAAIIADHQHVRTLMTELGVGVDLHVTRCRAVKQLLAELAEHAQREGHVLYRWADRQVGEDTRATWLARRSLF